MKLIKKLFEILFFNKYSKENFDKQLNDIDVYYKSKEFSEIQILHKQREYLDKIDCELDQQLKQILC